jgi:diaminohydroxyphosphoribosylaminopyrimidine deaminase/5-amino-6-(5-phosphoribosylamino)uracil reductase
MRGHTKNSPCSEKIGWSGAPFTTTPWMPVPINIEEESYLSRALSLARRAAGGVSPRPPVGAVIVKDGLIVGEGATEARPGRHAEVVAIQQAGAATRGATMFCTLEPHAHQGVAAPCTEEIIRAGIARVVCPIEDLNPKVNGNGFRRLRGAGVEVVTDVPAVLVEEAEDLAGGFAMLVTAGRPRITLKFAMSLDGKIATRSGDSQWITGEEARAEAHEMRRMADALITGIGTVLADNPRMTARDAAGAHTGRPRLRVVVDTRARLPETAALLREPGDVLWVRGEGAGRVIANRQVEAVSLPVRDGHVDIAALVTALGDREVADALVESGGTLAGAFLDAGLADRLAAFIAPVVIGGAGAPGPFAGEGPDRLADALRLEHVRMRRLGQDILVTGQRPAPDLLAEKPG